MASEESFPHWLRRYGNAAAYQWRQVQSEGRSFFSRPLGLVEFAFDGDGRFFEGRADINNLLEVRIKSTLSKDAFRERILLAWTALRCRHALLKAKSVQDESAASDSIAPLGMHFQVDIHDNRQDAVHAASQHIVFMDDHFEKVDTADFFHHCQNTARVVDPTKALSKLFVMPLVDMNGKPLLQCLFVGGHEIMDGLSCAAWNQDFIELLNDPLAQLQDKIDAAITPASLAAALPPPQEALYPAIPGSRARQRWFWAITRILRHVRRPLRRGFANPMLRRGAGGRGGGPKPPGVVVGRLPPPTYHPVLSYSTPPPLNTRAVTIFIPARPAARLHRLCREAGASIGAGCFALAAVVAMEMYEEQQQQQRQEEQRKASASASTDAQGEAAAAGVAPDFITGFPLDPRAFIRAHTGRPPARESLMLAFSDGLALPFLPAHLDLDARVRLLARRAHAQLAAYQKRQRVAVAAATTTTKTKGSDIRGESSGSGGSGGSGGGGLFDEQDDTETQRRQRAGMLTSRGAGLVLANQYLASMERAEAVQLAAGGKTGVAAAAVVQGRFPARANATAQTHGVSSVGRRDALLVRGRYALDDDDAPGSTSVFVADFWDSRMSVRAREGEFLLGIGGQDDGIYATASADVTTLDPELIAQWKQRIEHVLDDAIDAEKAKL